MGTNDPSNVLANNNRVLPVSAANIATLNSDAINKTTGNSKSCSKSESRKINSDTCAENNVQGNEQMCQSNNHQQRRRHHLQSHQHQSPAMQHPQSNGKQSMNLANAGKKIRRALSMPRNPFRWSRKFKTNCPNSNNNKPASTIMSGRNSIGSLVVGGVGESDVGGGDGKRDGNGGEGNAKRSGNNGYNTFPTSVNLVSSKEKSKTGRSINGSESEGGGQRTSNSELDNNKNQQYQHRIFRRSSFRKFLNRIAQHVSSVGSIGENKHASTSSSLADRVPPIGGYQWPADQTPGVMGLKNHGNTCFMNAVLQCLSHTDILAEYFVLDQYKVDLKKRNKNNSRKFGTKGELTEQLANVLKALWTCKNESDHSTSFKAVVDRYGSQFRSSTQHDAQEFLFWLLDKVHEDLNTATKRRYKNVKNNYGRSDEVIAAETLANYIRCNNSFVQAVFQAQFRSSLTCPRCKKQSNTFDPFHCISVQLPQLTQQAVFVTVLYVKRHPRQVKLGLTVPVGSPIVALKEQLQKDTGIPRNRMILAEINTTGFSRVFYDNQPVSTLESVTSVYCIEIPEVNSDVSSDLLLLIANVRKTKEGTVERFGLPFCVQVPRDCSYTELQKKLLKEMSPILKPEIFAYSIPLTSMFQIRLQDPSADPDTYLEHVEHPLFTEMIDLALSVLSNDAGPAHIKLLLEWVEPGDYFMDMSDYVVEHESVTRLKANKSTNTALTLEQCLEHYTKAETLSAEDAWRCPHCQQYLPVVKTLGLWSLPDILVIHFKRFRQHHDKGPDAAKLTTMVNFPLNAFDMSPHLARGTGSNSIDSLNSDSSTAQGFSHRSPWKKTREYRNRTDKENRDTRYDLYAVCYHQGDTLETGHYTAACKNPYDHQWYKFDDQRVSRVESDCIDEEIINNEAYMLFYQRRTNDNGECSGSSSNSGDHWVSKIAMPTATSVVPTTPANLKIDEKSEKSLTPTIPSDSETATEEPNARPVPLLESPSAVTTTVVIEKTDENEVVDIEGIEFVDEIPSIDDTERILAHEETNGVLTNKNENISDVLKTPPKHSPASKTNSNVPIDIIPSTSVDEPSIKGPKKEMAPASPVKVPVQKVNSSFPIDIKTSLPKHTQSPTSVQSSSSSSHFNHFNGTRTTNFKEALSSSLNSNSSSIMVSLSHDYNRGINGSGSNACLNGNGHCVNLRHSFSNSSNYILKDCTDTLSSMLRNTANTCSKDTLIFIDQQSHNLIDDDDSFLSSPSLWISPVTPHKLITVSPKN